MVKTDAHRARSRSARNGNCAPSAIEASSILSLAVHCGIVPIRASKVTAAISLKRRNGRIRIATIVLPSSVNDGARETNRNVAREVVKDNSASASFTKIKWIASMVVNSNQAS